MTLANSGAVYRLLDANANRAREALRVVEDYARFVLDHDDLSARLKRLRHELSAVTRQWPDAILHRDTPGDVGTGHATPAEFVREDVAAVVTAAGKRFGEAVRAIEEFAKTVDPAAAAALESIRYRFYDVEQAVARTLRPAGRFGDVRLYVLITESACRRPWFETAELAIAGGADALQLREKTLDGGELLTRAKRLVTLCRSRGVLCLVNDRADVAVASGADGLHVGQGDLPAAEARKLVGTGLLLGVSTHELAHAEGAVTDGADYVGVGPVFRSPTKPRDISPGLPYAAQVARRVKLPAVAIAGITVENVGQVLATGLRTIAVTAAVTAAVDPRAAAAALKAAMTSV